jgi:hypothetical protein
MSEAPESWIAFKAVALELKALVANAHKMSTEDRQVALIRALSRLEVAALDLPDVSTDKEGESGPNTYDLNRAAVTASFPELGYYHSIRPSSPVEDQEVTIGDAVDDLSDILRDIDEALWVETLKGWRKGVWEARFGYEHHFGAHLADLRSHLYRLRFFGY